MSKIVLAQTSMSGWYVDRHKNKWYTESLGNDRERCDQCRRNATIFVVSNRGKYVCMHCVEFIETHGKR